MHVLVHALFPYGYQIRRRIAVGEGGLSVSFMGRRCRKVCGRMIIRLSPGEPAGHIRGGWLGGGDVRHHHLSDELSVLSLVSKVRE